MSGAKTSGGCQCGALRYAFEGAPTLVAVCHCRMCQKAVGSIAWPFFTVSRAAFEWTRGAPAHYRSSAVAKRGFCAACGTPLSFEADGEPTIDVGVGTLDEPARHKPTAQVWVASRMPWYAEMASLPVMGMGDALPADEVARRRPYQHPDHDTDRWPPEGAVR